MGLRLLRRIMVAYFRNKTKEATSAYGRNLIMDMVVELSASERSRARMDHLVCVNLSGTRGGYLFRDKVNEMYVQQVKEQLKRQHSDHHDLTVIHQKLFQHFTNYLQIQTLIKSLSHMQGLHRYKISLKFCLLTFLTQAQPEVKDV